MRKVTFVSLISFIFLALCSVFECLFRKIPFTEAWIPLVMGVLILITSGILFNYVKSKVGGNILCFIMNSLALGQKSGNPWIFNYQDDSSI